MESNYLELVKRVAGNGAKLKYRKLFPLLNLCPVSPPPPAQCSFYSQATHHCGRTARGRPRPRTQRCPCNTYGPFHFVQHLKPILNNTVPRTTRGDEDQVGCSVSARKRQPLSGVPLSATGLTHAVHTGCGEGRLGQAAALPAWPPCRPSQQASRTWACAHCGPRIPSIAERSHQPETPALGHTGQPGREAPRPRRGPNSDLRSSCTDGERALLAS